MLGPFLNDLHKNKITILYQIYETVVDFFFEMASLNLVSNTRHRSNLVIPIKQITT